MSAPEDGRTECERTFRHDGLTMECEREAGHAGRCGFDRRHLRRGQDRRAARLSSPTREPVGVIGYQKCPVCEGRGEMPIGFYNAHGSGSASTTANERCRTCDGATVLSVHPVGGVPSVGAEREAWWAGDQTGRDPGQELNVLRRAVADIMGADDDTWPEHGNAPLAIATKVMVDKLEIERLRAWVDDLQSGMYVNCVYCGHRYGPGDTTPVSMADALKAHVEQCPDHPMSALRAEVEQLRAAPEGVGETREALARIAEARVHAFRDDDTCAWCSGPLGLDFADSHHDETCPTSIASRALARPTTSSESRGDDHG